MSFYGCQFSFDGIPCAEFGLMMYEFGQSDNESGTLSTGVNIIEDRIPRRYTPLFYGAYMNSPLEFTMTFGADPDAIDRDTFLDRWDFDAISSWLTGHTEYKWLDIEQPDMEAFHYRCFITNLRHIDSGMIPWGITCNVVCDSPFAYLYPETYSYTVNGETEIRFFNKSSYHGFYKPKLEAVLQAGGTLSIRNEDDGGREMTFTGLPAAVHNLTVDNENEVIVCDELTNPYPYFNFNFLRLKRGFNRLTVTGNGTITLRCEFPVSIGG